MPSNRRVPNPPETYEVQINPNTLAIALESGLQAALKPVYEEVITLREEVSQLKEQQRALLEALAEKPIVLDTELW